MPRSFWLLTLKYCTVAVLACFSILLTPHAPAQALPAADAGSTTGSATTNDAGPGGIIPYSKGFNASVATSSQHDSSDGWSSILSPDVAYRFNSHFSVDAGTPIYTYINVLVTGGTKARPTQTYQTKNFTPGDTSLNGHYETSFSLLDYNATATLGLPTGEQSYGLGAGQVTYNFNNHFERAFGHLSPDLELGIGDSSSLVAERVRKSFTSVGPLAHFQAGTSVDLPGNMNFSADAYEDLPIANNTVYSTTGRGRKKKTVANTTGPAEDNGFLTSLDIPLSGHITLSGFYNRSLRAHIDTAGFSFLFSLKAPPKDIVR